MKGRKIGQIDVSIVEMQKIVDMTNQKCTRPEIAKAVRRSVNTVWRYQKKFNLV